MAPKRHDAAVMFASQCAIVSSKDVFKGNIFHRKYIHVAHLILFYTICFSPPL